MGEERILTNKIIKNPYSLRGIEKIPCLGHLRYMNRLDFEELSITPKEGTKDCEEMSKSEDYHTTASSLIILGKFLYFFPINFIFNFS